MSLNVFQREIPVWAIVAAVVGVLALAFVAWRSLDTNAAGPPKQVHPGMYDLRQEIQKARARQAVPGATSGS
jgi:hypothetical protein